MKHKKGSVLDIGTLMIFIFVAAILFVLIDHGMNEFNTRWGNNTVVNSSTASVTAVNDVTTLADDRLDYALFVILIAFSLAIIITGYLVAAHPIFIFIYFIVLAIFVAVSAVFSFVWHKVSILNVFSGIIDNFPITGFILSNFPIYISIVGFLGLIMLYINYNQNA